MTLESPVKGRRKVELTRLELRREAGRMEAKN